MASPPSILDNIEEGFVLNDFQFDKILGSGQYGKVFEVSSKNSGKLACKVILNGCDNESEILKMFNHENVIKFVSLTSNNAYNFIFMELCERGSLLDFLQHRGELTEHEASVIFRQINLGVRHIHQKKYLHGDLKLDNIFLNQQIDGRQSG